MNFHKINIYKGRFQIFSYNSITVLSLLQYYYIQPI